MNEMTTISREQRPYSEAAKKALSRKPALFINNEWVASSHDATIPVEDPSCGKEVSRIVDASDKDVDRAVAAARAAFDDGRWSNLPPMVRDRTMHRLADLLEAHADEFAELEAIDNGKPKGMAGAVDIPGAISQIRFMAGWASKVGGETTAPYTMPAGTVFSYTVKEPVGVCAQIVPWNFPLLMLAWKIAPALATGNTVVLKPAETTPLTALLFAQVCQQAELPAGVVNIITGDGATGAAIVNHPGISKIAFTGSTDVGKLIARSVAGTGKGLTLELGGKGANIVFEDAPLDETVEGIINGIFFNQGHVCCAGSRLLIQENIQDEFLEKLKRRMSQIRLGDPLDKNTDIGAINSREQLEKITELAISGDTEGAERFSAACTIPAKGFWYPPTFFTGVTQAHRIAREEIFGPVLSVISFRTPQEAIEKANNTPFGLSAGVWTDKGSRILWSAKHLRAGVIWANTFNKFDPASPFGGYKESGWGREGGRHGLAAYLKGAK